MHSGTAGSAHLIYSEALPPPGWKGFSCGAELVGDKGLMEVDPYNTVKVARDGATEWDTVYDIAAVEDPRQKAFADEVRDFITCIVDDTPPPDTGEDGRAAVEIALAAYRSSHTGEAISCPSRIDSWGCLSSRRMILHGQRAFIAGESEPGP